MPVILLRSYPDKFLIGPYQAPLHHNHDIATINKPIPGLFLPLRPDEHLITMTKAMLGFRQITDNLAGATKRILDL